MHQITSSSQNNVKPFTDITSSKVLFLLFYIQGLYIRLRFVWCLNKVIDDDDDDDDVWINF